MGAAILLGVLTVPAFAQQRAPQKPLLGCGAHGGAEVICGTRAPEDLELTPDGKYLIVSQFVTFRGTATHGDIMLMDLAAKTFSDLPMTAAPLPDWGDASCPGPIGDKLGPHGISLSKRADGKLQLYVVNHGGRESIEMFELGKTAGRWGLVWHGCVVTKQAFNDVAALTDGSFVASQPEAIRKTDLFDGKPTGYVVRWTKDRGERELPGTRSGYPNGVLVSADGRYLYYNAWTAKEVHKYDLRSEKDVGVAKLDFMPDNITWKNDGGLLAAGIKGVGGACPAGSGTPCLQAFGVASIDTANMTAKTVYDSAGKDALISGVSVALQAGSDIYVGAFQGNRIARIPLR
jgi:hypothetical protein